MAVKRLSVILLFIVLLTGCGTSQQEAFEQSIEVAEDTFYAKKTEPTETADGIHYYLPPGFNANSELENNLILSKGNQEYILFVNPLEDPKSEEIFESLKESKDTDTQSFSSDNQFGYISVTPMKDKLYELIVGIGGVKLTTQTTANDMVENAKIMMEIVQSVQYEEETQ